MTLKNSVTTWIDRAKLGDESALQRLWERYRPDLEHRARHHLAGALQRAADEEDVVQNVFTSFWRGITNDRFQLLRDRNSLWPLLEVLVRRKAADYRQHEQRLKRGGGAVRGESAVTPRHQISGFGGLDAVDANELTPDVLVAASDMVDRLMDCLGDDMLRRIALLKFNGFTDQELADDLGCARSTIARKLGLIRKIWQSEPGDS